MRGLRWLMVAGILLLPLLGLTAWMMWKEPKVVDQPPGTVLVTVEITEYNPPPPDAWELVDDQLRDKQTSFDPELVDRRPVGPWQVNQSAAVIRLDTPLILPDAEPKLLTLHPTYAAAAQSFPREQVIPSVNALDGKAKQVDDGLYAALELAHYRGVTSELRGHVALVQAMYEQLPPNSPARAFLAAALTYAGVEVVVDDVAARDDWRRRFDTNEVASKPISFYTWTAELQACWKFLRFLQRPFITDETVPRDLAAVLASDVELRHDYERLQQFFTRLTNRPGCLSLVDVIGAKEPNGGRTVAFYPPSTSKENVLFTQLFSNGLPSDVSVMQALIKAIRSGEVDLAPATDSGWYEHQVFALETLLLPERGEESHKLLLTKAYKKRMLEAFQALVTKRRETHARSMEAATAGAELSPAPPQEISPRLRIEPNPSFYLRTARAYAFLELFLESALGTTTLSTLHGLRAEGERPDSLATELAFMKDLFYGLYLVSAEDIGHRPTLAADELDSTERCYELAVQWLEGAWNDLDLQADTRVSIPIVTAPLQGKTRLWATLGVRMLKLDASYAVGPGVPPPSIKPVEGESEWEEVGQHLLEPVVYYIPVDEFAEIELNGVRSLTREEFRAVCDREKTKAAILTAFQTP